MKPSVKLCDLIRCPKLWPDFSGGGAPRCGVMGMVPGHMDHCPDKRLHNLSEMTEVLADLEHRQWRHWTRYMLDNMTPENIERWKRQIKTSYSQLSEKEKESDRVWARKVLARLLKEKMVDVNVITREDLAELRNGESDQS